MGTGYVGKVSGLTGGGGEQGLSPASPPETFHGKNGAREKVLKMEKVEKMRKNGKGKEETEGNGKK